MNAHLSTYFGSAMGVALLLAIVGEYVSEANSYSANDPSYNRSYWSSQVRTLGSASAYAEFKLKNQEVETRRQHLATHVFGEVLFDVKGVEGVSACDSEFGFGCFHGFFSRSVSVEGLGLVRALNEECLKEYGPLGTGCLHGIGHGILEYLGQDKLREALDACKMTTQVVPLLGCTSGVFMEYNTPLTITESSAIAVPREFDEHSESGMCSELPLEYHASCYFELGNWLPVALKKDFDSAAKYCGTLTEEDKKHCFLGFGVTVANMEQHVIENVLLRCSDLDNEAEVYCRAGASWAFFTSTEYKDIAPTLCDGLGGVARAQCLKLADFTERWGH